MTYEVPYHPGKLEAVSYLNGAEAGRTVLQTAGKAVKLKVEADRNELPADGESLTFIKIRLEDAAGNFNRRESAAVTMKVEDVLHCRDSEVQIRAAKEVTSLIHGIPMTAV